MLCPVQLDNQSTIEGAKVSNVRSNGILSPKLHAQNPAIPQLHPQLFFGVSLIAPQDPGSVSIEKSFGQSILEFRYGTRDSVFFKRSLTRTLSPLWERA